MGVEPGSVSLEVSLEVSRALKIFVPFDSATFLLKSPVTKSDKYLSTKMFVTTLCRQ